MVIRHLEEGLKALFEQRPNKLIDGQRASLEARSKLDDEAFREFMNKNPTVLAMGSEARLQFYQALLGISRAYARQLLSNPMYYGPSLFCDFEIDWKYQDKQLSFESTENKEAVEWATKYLLPRYPARAWTIAAKNVGLNKDIVLKLLELD